MKRFVAILLSLTMMLGLTACNGSQQHSGGQSSGAPSGSSSNAAPETVVKDTIKVALPKNVTSMNGSTGGLNAFNPLFQIYDMLVEMDENMQLVSKLATEWEMVDDYTWRFTLREGVKFHDGSDFTAEDAKASIDRIVNMDPKYFYAANWVNSWPPAAEIESDYSLLIKTPVLNLKVPEMLSRVPMVPAEYAENENFFVDTLIGTGGYKFVSWEPGVSIKLEAYEDYWDGAPQVKNLQYDMVTDEAARVNAFRSGEYDVVFDISYDNIEPLQSSGYRIDIRDNVSVSMVYFNPMNFENNPIMADSRIRQAMSYAIDSYGIVEAIMHSHGHVMEGIAAHQTVGANNSEPLPQQDLEKAKQLMQEAGYNGEKISFFYVEGEFNNALEICELIAAQLEEVGFNIEFTECEAGLWKSDYQGKAGWDICVNNAPGTFSGDSDYYWLHVLKNKIGWKSDVVDACMDAAYASETIEERTANFEAAMGEAWKLWPYLWATEGVSILGITTNLEGIGFVPLGSGLLYFRDAYYS